MNTFPAQKISLKEKQTRDKVTGMTWGESCVKYLIDNADWDNDLEEIARIKRIIHGEHNDEDYNYVLNPLNTNVAKYKRFGAKLRNFNILQPVRNLYLGEFGKRFQNIQVMETNPDDDNLYKKGLNLLVKNYYTQKVINELNALGISTGQESQEQAPLEEEIQEYKRKFDENRVITGQETLDFIKFDKDLDDKYMDVYTDWVDVGRAFTYKGISHNDIDFEWVPAEELSFPKNNKSRFIEDGAWAVRKEHCQPHEILDRFHDKLDEDAKDALHKELTQGTFNLGTEARHVVMPTQYIGTNDYRNARYRSLGTDGIGLYHAVWRSWRKIGYLTYIDEIGQIQEMEVDETYKLDKENGDLAIEWDWISEVWEGRYMDINDGYYFDVRPLPYNRMELNNSSKQKLPYNGRFMLTQDGRVASIMKTGEPYQVLYDITHYQFEKVLNKNKDKIAVIPQGLIPKGKNGWDEEKFMYYAHAGSMMMIDETSPTAGLAMQGIKVLDMSLGSYIKDMYEIMTAIKMEFWDAIGMNRQRFGDSKASDGKSVTEQAIFRSAIISEELNRKFEKFQEKDYAGLLDLSKLAYINGKKGKYINSEQREAFLSIAPDDALRRLESDYGVFVRNSAAENEKLEMLKQYAFSMAQNDRNPSLLTEVLDMTNFTKGKLILKELEEKERAYQQQVQQQDHQNNMEVEQVKEASKQADRDVEIYKADRDYDKVMDKALLELGKDNQQQQPEDDTEERRMNDHKIQTDNKKLDLDKEDLERKKKETNAKVKQMAKAPKVNS